MKDKCVPEQLPKPKPSTARLRLLAASVFAAIPAVSLPLFIHQLYSIRPHVTDAPAGFVLPHYRKGVVWYFAHADETLIHALSWWLLAAGLLLLFVGGQMSRRPLKQWLRPPEVPSVEAEDALREPDQIKT